MVTLTEAQTKALALLDRSEHRRILLYGGARSGKTFVICLYLLLRCIAYPGARVLIARQRTIHAVASIWRQTLLPLLRELFGPASAGGVYDVNKSEHVITFANGSEIWIGGLDDKERTEKLLGQEYLDIYLNEVSQIGYDAVQIVLTRLAQKLGPANKGLFDCNPPSPQHWTHRMFIELVEPKERRPYQDVQRFACMQINPEDNRENLPADFIASLDDLPAHTRARMKDGLFVMPEGAVYQIPDAAIIGEQDVPPLRDFTVGVDFGLNATAVLLGWDSDDVYVLDDCGGYNITSAELNTRITDMTATNWTLLGHPDGADEEGEYWERRTYTRAGRKVERWRSPPPMSYVAYCDPAGGERLQEISYAAKANNSVDAGLEWIQTKLNRGQYKIVRRASGVVSEVFDYRRDPDTGKVIKANDHYCDGMRYGGYSRVAMPLPRVRRV